MNKTQGNITKQDLKFELTIVKDEMGLMQKGLRDEMGVMKQDLEEKLSGLGGSLREEMSVMEESLDGKNRKYRDEILTGLDKVMKELETMREENTVGSYQTRELREEVDNHEKRITKLESPSHQ